MNTTRSVKRSLLIGITFLTFIAIGLPDGLLGVAWPSIRHDFGLPLDAMGSLLAVFTAGFLISSFNSGRIISQIGVGPMLVISNLLAAFGLIGYALAPSWQTMVACGLIVGLGSGTTDAGMNTYVAVNHSTRVMNWSHASFGIGATIGPMIMTMMLTWGLSWRYGYTLVAMLRILLALAFGLTLYQWGSSTARSDQPVASQTRMKLRSTLRLPVVWLSMILFIFHTGIELTAGQWSYSLFIEARAITPEIAGMWVSIYWASLTGGRLLIGFISERFENIHLMRMCALGVLSGAVMLSVQGPVEIGFLGLMILGFSISPVFPALVALSPGRVGPLHAPNAIGFQLSAAAMGGALLPGLTGVLAQKLSLEIVGPILVVSSIVMFGLNEAIVHLTSARRPAKHAG